MKANEVKKVRLALEALQYGQNVEINDISVTCVRVRPFKRFDIAGIELDIDEAISWILNI